MGASYVYGNCQSRASLYISKGCKPTCTYAIICVQMYIYIYMYKKHKCFVKFSMFEAHRDEAYLQDIWRDSRCVHQPARSAQYLFTHKRALTCFHHIQSSPLVVSPQFSVNPPTWSTSSYPALQKFTCYRVSPVTLPDFGGPDGGPISELDCIIKQKTHTRFLHVP